MLVKDGYAIEMRDVVKRFGEVNAVDHVSMEIRDGEFFSMLGPSGCGKTTSLRMIAGFEYPTSGDIFLNGVPIGNTPPFRRNVNTVFQSYALFPHMSVAENVAFGLEMKKVPRAEIAKRVDEALDMVRLGGFGARRPRQLSGGQQQRVALARALVNRPDVLLLDEPLGALDLKLRKEMQLELKGLQERVGITFIFVTHDQEEALTMSDRIAVMSAGKVLQFGTPTEIYERPNCRFVADFIGESNFVRGRVAAIDAGAVTVSESSGLTLRGQLVQPVQLGDEVYVSVRPEKARLSVQQPTGTPANIFPVTVDRVSYIGSDTRIMVHLGQDRLFNIWEQNTRSTVDRDAYWQRGEQGYLWWPVENALVLKD
ncbi:MAG: ABC transporter ATP-binding protein [Kouleothrix sp.]|jgi:spermidine/putrescine transport system ATP-binding protein|nr:ABC transporter ATP-binding protein [Kouleothrix sp.]